MAGCERLTSVWRDALPDAATAARDGAEQALTGLPRSDDIRRGRGIAIGDQAVVEKPFPIGLGMGMRLRVVVAVVRSGRVQRPCLAPRANGNGFVGHVASSCADRACAAGGLSG